MGFTVCYNVLKMKQIALFQTPCVLNLRLHRHYMGTNTMMLYNQLLSPNIRGLHLREYDLSWEARGRWFKRLYFRHLFLFSFSKKKTTKEKTNKKPTHL